MKSLLRHIGDTGQDVSKPSASHFMFSRVSATRLGGLNTGRRVAASFDLRPPALKALIRRHELICGARCCVVDMVAVSDADLRICDSVSAEGHDWLPKKKDRRHEDIHETGFT
jgi:hypothetical protein